MMRLMISVIIVLLSVYSSNAQTVVGAACTVATPPALTPTSLGCTFYHECVNSLIVLRQCPPPQTFDTSTNLCAPTGTCTVTTPAPTVPNVVPTAGTAVPTSSTGPVDPTSSTGPVDPTSSTGPVDPTSSTGPTLSTDSTLPTQSTPPVTQSTQPPASVPTVPTATPPPATQSTPPATQSTPPATQSTPPATQSTPPATQSTPPGTQSTPPATQSTQSSQPTQPTQPGTSLWPTGPITCTVAGPTYHGHHIRCDQFQICSNGQIFLRTCPSGQHWAPTLSRCDWPNVARCPHPL